MASQKLETVLAYVPMFHELSKREIRKIAALCDVADFMAGASIVKQGEPGDAFYVVLKGQAKVSTNGRFIGRITLGDHFGENRGPRRRGTDRDRDLRDADDPRDLAPEGSPEGPALRSEPLARS